MLYYLWIHIVRVIHFLQLLSLGISILPWPVGFGCE